MKTSSIITFKRAFNWIVKRIYQRRLKSYKKEARKEKNQAYNEMRKVQDSALIEEFSV